MKGGEEVNIGALQSLIGAATQAPLGNTQQGQATSQSFGTVFAGIASAATVVELPSSDASIEIPNELIQQLYNAQTTEELEQAIQAISGNVDVELPKQLDSTGPMGSLEDLSMTLSINPEKLLESIKKLLGQAGKAEEEITDLSMATDVWTLLTMIDEVGTKFFDKLNEALAEPQNEEVNLLTFLKAVEMTVSKSDMVVSMEQKAASFQSMLTGAAEQFDQKVANSAKQEIPQFIPQKTNFRIVLETESSLSSNENGAGQKQAETTTHVSSSGIPSISNVKAEFTISQTETNPANRSEALMKEMQALFKRSNFGQIGGSNRMLIKLYPEHLGQIRIELHESNGVMTARILASTALAKGMLESQLHQLKHAFNQQSLQVERIDITQSIQESSRNEREQSFNEQYKREQQENKQEKGNLSEDDISFDEYLIELEA